MQNNDIIIKKVEKGITIVIIDKDTYKKKMEAIISDRFKFEKHKIQKDIEILFLLKNI